MNRREQSKQERRQRILDSAKRLLEEHGAEGLTMRALASAAQVSEMTPYNLFGAKSGVIAALFETALEDIVAHSFDQSSTDPIDRIFLGAEALVQSWTQPSGLFREMMRCARDSGAELTRFAEAPIALLQAGLSDAAENGLITGEVPLDDLARHIFLANQGAYDPWLIGDSDDATLRRDLLVGIAVSLLAVATPATRPKILARLKTGRTRKRRR